MVKINFSKKGMKAGSKKQQEPRLVGGIIGEMLQGWNRNTELSVDLKTILRSDSKMKAGKNYQGILRRDEICEEFHYDEHFTFTETAPQPAQKRNPRVYDGDYITVTRRSDGSYHPNFKPMKVDKDFCVVRYASGVANELLWALEGLVENI